MQQQNIKKRVTKIITDTTDSHDNDDDTESITVEDTPDNPVLYYQYMHY